MPSRSRPRVGLLVRGIDYAYQMGLLRGADRECRLHDVDLVCIVGGDLASDHSANRAYDLLEGNSLDALMLASSTFGAGVHGPAFAELLRRFASKPVCSLGLELEGTLSVVVDPGTAVEELTTHLVAVHGRRRLAFIQGNSAESDARQRAFLRALDRAHLQPIASFAGNYYIDSGSAAVEQWLGDWSRASAQVCPVDAIVAANDWMAIGALKALAARGVSVPHQVSVAGFDDIEQARFEIPSLTTVRQPVDELGATGVRQVLRALRGKAGDPVLRLPTSLVVRKSCGCFAAGREPSQVTSAVKPPRLPRERRGGEVGAELEQSAPAFVAHLGAGWGARLARAFDAGLLAPDGREFEVALDEMIRKTLPFGHVAVWHHVLTVLRKQGLPSDATSEQTSRAFDLLEAAEIQVSTHAELVQGSGNLERENLLRALTYFCRALYLASDYQQVSYALLEWLPRLQVRTSLVCAHRGRLEPSGSLDVVAAHEREQVSSLMGVSFRAGQLLPTELDASRRRTWVGSVAAHQSDVLGYTWLEIDTVDGQRDAFILEQVGISLDALRMAAAVVEQVMLRERAERARLEGEFAIATRIQAGVLPRTLEVPGLQVAYAMRPASEVGGDYFDAITRTPFSWFAIGDVSGHGLPAGLVMMMIQSIVSGLVDVEPSAAASVAWRRLNRVLYDNVRGRLALDEYATLTLLRYGGQGLFNLAGAHEEPLVHRAASGQIATVATPGTWLAIRRDPPAEAVCDTLLTLERGDTLLLYTDGAIEAMNASGEVFGSQRLQAEFARASELTPDALVQRLMDAVANFSEDQRDDITLVALRYLGEDFAMTNAR